MTFIFFLGRIALALFLGSIIGFERQWRHRMAGIRTNALVALGAFLFVTLSSLKGDPSFTRIAAQVVSGIGFLGAGVIIREGVNIRGLNTAATLWCSAAIGTLTGSGLIIESIVGTVFILIANIFLRNFLQKFQKNTNSFEEEEYTYILRVECKEDTEFHIRTLLMHMVHDEKIMLMNLESTDTQGNRVQVTAKVLSSGKSHDILEKIASRISLETGIVSVGWEVAV